MGIVSSLRDPQLQAFAFCFVGLHFIWFNIQRKHVPLEQRTEIKAYRAIQKRLGYGSPEG